MHAKKIYVRLRDERRINLVRLIDANRNRRTAAGKAWQRVGRTLIGTFIAAFYTLRPASVPFPTTFDTVVLAAVATTSATLSRLWWL